MASLLVEIADRLRLTSPAARSAREAQYAHAAAIAKLEAKARSLIRGIEESYADFDNWIDPRERYMDGGTYYGPASGLIAGGRNDRLGGQSFPVLWSETHLQQLRGNARVLCDTNAFAIGMRDRHVDFVVGDGMKPEVALKGAKTNKEDHPAVKACQAVLDEWREINSWGAGPWNADPCDPSDDTGLIQNREREGYERAVTDGEFILRFFAGGSETNNLPVVRWIEPEDLLTPPGESMQGPWSWGIQVDPNDGEKRIAYHVQGLAEPKVPAGKVVFAKLNTVSTVKRGITDFFPVGASLERIRKLLDAMGEVAAILSQIAYLRQHAPGVTGTQVSNMIGNLKDRDAKRPNIPGGWGNTSTIPTVYQEPGVVHDVSNGMQYVPPPMQAGATSFIAVQQAILRGVGQRWGMPEFFSGDASNNNYASIAVTGSPFERAVKSRQSWYAMVQRAIYGKVLAYACRSGRLSEADVRAVEVKITPTSASATDALKEAQTNEILCRNKVMSPQTWAAKAGLDADHEQNQIQAHDEAFPDNNDPFGGGGFDFGGGGNGGPAGDPGEDPTGGAFDKALGEAVLSEGFTGTKTDSLGREIHYRDGKRVGGDGDEKKLPKEKKAKASKMTIKSLEKQADDYGRQALAAKAAGDHEKAFQLNAASYGLRRAAKHIEDGDKEKAAKSVELAGKIASGEVKLQQPSVRPKEPQP